MLEQLHQFNPVNLQPSTVSTTTTNYHVWLVKIDNEPHRDPADQDSPDDHAEQIPPSNRGHPGQGRRQIQALTSFR